MSNRALMAAAVLILAGLSGACGGSNETRTAREAQPPVTGSAPASVAAASSKTQAPLHGGLVADAGSQRFETVLAGDRLLVYAYTSSGAPATMHSASGNVTLQLPDGTSKEVALAREAPASGEPAIYFCPMHASVVRSAPGQCELCGGMKLYTQDRLAAAVGPSALPAKGVKASIRIGDDASKQVAFAQTLGGAVSTPAVSTPAVPTPAMPTPAVPTPVAPAGGPNGG